MIARPSPCFPALLLAGWSALCAAGCSVETPGEPRAVAAPTPTASATLAPAVPVAMPEHEVGSNLPTPEAPTESNVARPALGKSKSSWSPDTLDTGVDLSGVRLAASVANSQESAPPEPAVAKAPPVQRPATTYAGGPPDPNKFAGAGEPQGFLSVGESAAVHDFGRLTQGDRVSHTFELETSGDGPLVVREIKTSCGCTVAQTDVVTAEGKVPYVLGTPLAPGSSLFVGAQLDTRTKSAAVLSVITVESSDPRGYLQLQLKAHVSPFFAIEPKIINFGRLEADAVVEQELLVTSPMVERYKLSVMSVQMPSELSVTLVPKDPDDEGRAGIWHARVKLGPNIPEGRKNYQVLFTSDQPSSALASNGQPEMHTVHVLATAEVVGMVSAVPAYFSFGMMQSGQVVSRTARIANYDADFSMAAPTPTLKGYQGDFEYPDHVSFEVVPILAGKQYDLVMTLRAPDGLSGTLRGQVILELGHPAKPTLEIPFTGVVRPSPTPRPKAKEQ